MPDKKPISKIAVLAFLIVLASIVVSVLFGLWQPVVIGVVAFFALAAIEAGANR
jgi:hypothetical protein